MAGMSNADIGRLYREYHEILVGRIFIRIVPFRGTREDAEDIKQKAWTRAIPILRLDPAEGGYDPTRASFPHWFMEAFGKYCIKEWLKDRQRRPLPLPPVVPAGPNKSPDEDVRLEAFKHMFYCTFLCGGYPHEQLAFGLSQVIYGEQSNRGIEGNPQKVEECHADRPLRNLLAEFWEAFKAQQRDVADPQRLAFLDSCLNPVRQRLECRKSVLLREHAAGPGYNQDPLVGETCLRSYWNPGGRTFTETISDWCFRVKKRVREVVTKGPAACQHCKLRHAPPCAK